MPNETRVVTFEHQDCVNCHIVFMVPTGFSRDRIRDKANFFCPNGHSMSYRKSEADKLKEKLHAEEQARQAAERNAAQERRWRQEAETQVQHVGRRLAAQKGVTTRLKNRVANGVCPCCNRTFVNLQRHMASKHAGFAVEDVQQEVGTNVH